MIEKELDPINIMAVTADVTTRNKQKCLRSGFDRVMTKPVYRKDLRAILEEYL